MFVLDTNFLSELRLPMRANPGVLAWSNATPAEQTFLSVMTILEIETGALLMERKDPARGTVLKDWIAVTVLPHYAGRILDVDTDVARCCAGLHVPTTRPQRDALIAATAIVHGMTVVTRNVADFQMGSVKVLNPWS